MHQFVIIEGRRVAVQTIPEFARDHKVSEKTVRRWINLSADRLPNLRPRFRGGRGHAILIPQVEGRNWLNRHAPLGPTDGYYYG